MSNGKTELLKTQIQQDFPDLVINSIKVIGTGWHHNAVDINGSIIFRIPHHTYGHDITPVTVNYETELLKRLKGKVPVSIPDPRYIAPNNDYFGSCYSFGLRAASFKRKGYSYINNRCI